MDIEVVDEPVRTVLVVRREVRMDQLAEFFSEAFGRCVHAATSLHKEIGGAPFAWYHGTPTTTVEVSAGIPVEYVTGELPEGVAVEDRPGGRSVVAMHVGPYETLHETYQAIEAWMAEHGLAGTDDMWEEYLTDPGVEPDPTTWQTRLVVPIDPTLAV